MDFSTADGRHVVRYAGLKAWDAEGRSLPAWMEMGDREGATIISLLVEDHAATYPVFIDPLATNPSWTANAGQSGALFGESIASAGDVNGDGFDDVIVGARLFDNGLSFAGKAFVFHGSPAGLSPTPDWTIEGDQQGGQLGWSVAGAGDVNGDGFDDVLVGAAKYSNPQQEEGRVYLYLGSPTGLSSSAAWTKDGQRAYVEFGHAVAAAGDVNGDGYGDIALGVPFNYPAGGQYSYGGVFVYYGSSNGLANKADWSMESSEANSWFGYSAAGAGDVNGDGFDDLIVGAPFCVSPTACGAAHGYASIYYGSSQGLSQSADWTAVSSRNNSYFGQSVSGAGDVNGDGFDDVIVGSPNMTFPEYRQGAAYIYHGSATGPSSAENWAVFGELAGDNYGSSVAGAGDVNGDAYGDVIVGAPQHYTSGPHNGKAYAYFGSSTGLSTTPAWVTDGGVSSSVGYGTCVATAGDVDGDGFDEALVGAPAYNVGPILGGRAFLYEGSDILTPAGSVPDGSTVPGVPLEIALEPSGDITLTWGPSCSGGDTDYEIYEAFLTALAVPAPITCGTGGTTTYTFTPAFPNAPQYYVVVPRNPFSEGSYGLRSDGSERPASSSACMPQVIGTCGP